MISCESTDSKKDILLYINSPGGIELHPRNKNFSIIKINSSDNFNINGVLLYSFRNYLN